MSIEANFKRGVQYWYVHRGGLLLGKGKSIGLYLECPEPRADFHRVEINVVRTKAEAMALNRKMAKARRTRKAKA